MSFLAEHRKYQYDYHSKLYPYVNDWKRSPYTWFKARFYMEASAVLVYFLLKTKIKPNTLSIVYCLLGLTGGILLAIPVSQVTLIAVFIFFSKGILDWSDGHLARIRKQTSLTGAILDPYGSLLGTLAFRTGLGFYVAQKSGMSIFCYLAALIPFFYAAELHPYAFYALFIEHLTPKKIKEYRKNNMLGIEDEFGKEKTDRILSKKFFAAYAFLKSFLDDRARTVDFVCFLILLEVFTPIFVTWIVFLGFVIKRFLICSASFCVIAKGGWVEQKFEDKVKEISKDFALND